MNHLDYNSSRFSKLRQSCESRNIPILSSNTEKFLRELLPTRGIENALEIGSAV